MKDLELESELEKDFRRLHNLLKPLVTSEITLSNLDQLLEELRTVDDGSFKIKYLAMVLKAFQQLSYNIEKFKKGCNELNLSLEYKELLLCAMALERDTWLRFVLWQEEYLK